MRKYTGFYISALLYGVDKLKYRKETAHNIKILSSRSTT